MTDTLTLPDRARSLCLDGDRLYAGCQDNKLRILDRATLAVTKEWETPSSVQDLVVAGTTLYGAVGFGLAAWDDRALTSEATITPNLDRNILKLATDGTALFWGTAWGEVWQYPPATQLASVKKMLTSIAADASYVYVGYRDGKLRLFPRGKGKKRQLDIPGKGGVRTMFAGDVMFTVNSWVGTFTRWRNLEAETTWSVDIDRSTYGILGETTNGSWVVYHTAAKVAVHDIEGALVGTWYRTPKEGEGYTVIEDVVIDGETLIVAHGTCVERLSKSALK